MKPLNKKIMFVFLLLLAIGVVAASVEGATLWDSVKNLKNTNMKNVGVGIGNFVIVYVIIYLLFNFIPGLSKQLQKDSYNSGAQQYIIYIIIAALSIVVAVKLGNTWIWQSLTKFEQIRWFLFYQNKFTIRPIVNTMIVAIIIMIAKTYIKALDLPTEKDSKSLVWILAIIIGAMIAHSAAFGGASGEVQMNEWVWDGKFVLKAEVYLLGARKGTTIGSGHTGWYCEGTSKIGSCTGKERFGILSTKAEVTPKDIRRPLMAFIASFIFYFLIFDLVAKMGKSAIFKILYVFLAANQASHAANLVSVIGSVYWLILWILYNQMKKEMGSNAAGGFAFAVVHTVATGIGYAPKWVVTALPSTPLFGNVFASNFLIGWLLGFLLGMLFGEGGAISGAWKKGSKDAKAAAAEKIVGGIKQIPKTMLDILKYMKAGMGNWWNVAALITGIVTATAIAPWWIVIPLMKLLGAGGFLKVIIDYSNSGNDGKAKKTIDKIKGIKTDLDKAKNILIKKENSLSVTLQGILQRKKSEINMGSPENFENMFIYLSRQIPLINFNDMKMYLDTQRATYNALHKFLFGEGEQANNAIHIYGTFLERELYPSIITELKAIKNLENDYEKSSKKAGELFENLQSYTKEEMSKIIELFGKRT